MAEVKHNFDDLRDAALPQFPKAVYHDTYDAVVVSGPEELKGLGPGWRDHPDMAYAKFVTGEEPQSEEKRPELYQEEIGRKPKPVKLTDLKPPKGY